MKIPSSITHTALALATLLFSSQGMRGAEEPTWFIDTNYVYQHGTKLSKQYLETKHPSFSAQLEKTLPWIVRIEVQHGFNGDGYLSNHGTGIILKGGKVLTAKHTLTQNVADTSNLKILLTTVDGTVIPATPAQLGEKDWSVLQMNTSDNHLVLHDSPIQLAAPKKEETAIFLGYPARLGLDSEGVVQSFHKGNTEKNIPVSQLYPMVVVTSVSDTKAMDLTPLAGFPAVSGMSGGPVFNLQGQVIAVQHSISTTTANDTGQVLRYTIDATSISDIQMK